MKKLMLIALLALGATAFAADEATTVTTQPMTIGESFMAAFGMGDLAGKSVEDVENVDTVTTSTSSVASASAAANVAATIANNSVTIVTPYGKY